MQNRVKDNNRSLEQKEQGGGRGVGLEEGRAGSKAHLSVERSGVQKYVPVNIIWYVKKQSNLKVLENYNFPI